MFIYSNNVSSVPDDQHEYIELLHEVISWYESLVSHSKTSADGAYSSVLSRVNQWMNAKKEELTASSQTCQLWLKYQNNLRICRKFITSDRTGSWDDHMKATAEALSIFTAAGHFNYLKSAYSNQQRMVSILFTHQAADKVLRGGFHAIRRSDRFWAILGADLVIEQVFMRWLKSTGGLTRGSGMTEAQRALWTMSMPACAQYSVAMKKLTQIGYNSCAPQGSDWCYEETWQTWWRFISS